MQIITKKIEELKPAEYNPRKLTEKQAEDLTESIKRFGFAEPIIINTHKGRENVIVGGHQRFYIARELGFKELPCVEVSLPLEKEQELNLRLNKNTGEWDFDLLANFNEGMLLDVGFDQKELEVHFGLETEEQESGVVKRGNALQLGKHKLKFSCCKDASPVAHNKMSEDLIEWYNNRGVAG